MNLDDYLFFTRCHVLFVQGFRRAILDRLSNEYGGDWWSKGVERALAEEQLGVLRIRIERDPNRERHLLLDAGHFERIIRHNHRVFAEAFIDTSRISDQLRTLTNIRNAWAHIEDIPLRRVRVAVDQMRRILTSLNREEALEIEQVSQGVVLSPPSIEQEVYMNEFDHPYHDVDVQEPSGMPSDMWRQLHSYLVLEKSVTMPDDENQGQARVTFTVHNTAPDSRNVPAVHFQSIVIEVSGHGRSELGQLGPGETREKEFSFPTKQLIDIEFEVHGAIDANRLFQLRRTTGLPDDVIGPLQQQFSERMEAIGIKDIVSRILDTIESIGPQTPFAEVSKLRASFKSMVESIGQKRSDLAGLSEEFHLGRDFPLGARMREIILALVEFESKFAEFDNAIADTDLPSIAQAVHNLKQTQLAVLRVEDTLIDLKSRS